MRTPSNSTAASGFLNAQRRHRKKLTKLACELGALLALSAQAGDNVIEIHAGPISGETMVLDNARGTPWCEVPPATGTPPALTVQVYNTTSVDNCPVERVAKLDPGKLTGLMKVPKVFLNGGRYWAIRRPPPGRDRNGRSCRARTSRRHPRSESVP
jgi:hypothetical protein